jgi:hypothetical protein
MVLLTLMIYPIFYMYAPTIPYEAPLKPGMHHSPDWGSYIFSISLFVLATCSASTFFVFGQRELFGKHAGWKTVLYLPFLMALGVGMGLNNARAVLEAFWSSLKKKESEFVRTPKYGVTGADRKKWRQERVFTLKRLYLPVLEVAMGAYMMMCIWISVMWHIGRSSIPFLLIFAGGYLYVGFSSLYALYRMNREAEVATLEPEIVEPAST